MAYDPAQAVFWSSFVDRAYSNFNADVPNPKTPKCFPAGWEFEGNLQVYLELFDTTYFIGWIASASDASETAVVFLGTEHLEWLYDAGVPHTHHPIGGLVEEGMYDMYKSLAIAQPGQSGTQPLSTFLEQLNVDNLIHVTGHSLGGALTTFTAADVASLSPAPNPDNLRVYSLASPRVGDSDFAAAFNTLVPNNFRIYNIRDYVPTLPPEILGYTHVQTAEPVPPLDSWKYPVYHGWNPIKTIGCYHSHTVYNYMLKVRDGQQPDPHEMRTCYVTSQLPKSVSIQYESRPDS